jgi:hypothetical protein
MLLSINQPSLQEIWQGFGQGGAGGGGGKGGFHFLVERVLTVLQEVCLRRKSAHTRAYDVYFHLDALLPTGIE